MKDGIAALILVVTAALATVTLAALRPLGAPAPVPAEHEILVTASSYAFEPAVLRVRRGDTLRLRFASTDVVHGFYLEGYDLDVTVRPLAREVEVTRGGATRTVEEVVLVADRGGKFHYRCSRTCGPMHPFMSGELVVGPNPLWPVSAAASAGVLLGGFGLVWIRSSVGRRA